MATSLLRSAAVAVALLIFLRAAAAAEWGCNATRIGDCLVDADAYDGGKELLMESETSRRLLIGSKTITPGGQIGKKPFCNRNVFASCIGRPNKFYDKRHCGYNNLCRTEA